MRFALLTLALATFHIGGADANRLTCPRVGKPRTLDFVKGSDATAASVGAYGGLMFDNFNFNNQKPLPCDCPNAECGYAITQYSIFNGEGNPGSIYPQLNKCWWQPLSATVNAAWWDGLWVYFVGINDKLQSTGYAEALVNTQQTTVIDLTPLGTVKWVYVGTEKDPSATKGTAPSCVDGNRTQAVISSFTYQGAKSQGKPSTKMYVKSVGDSDRMAAIVERIHGNGL